MISSNKSYSLNFKYIIGQTNDNGTTNVKIGVPLKSVSKFGELLKCIYFIVKLIFFRIGMKIVL